MIPIRTREALEEIGLTEEQVQKAWDIIIDHLGIYSPPGEITKKQEPKHTIPITEMIKDEVHRLKDIPPEDTPSDTTQPVKTRTTRKRGGKW